MKRFEEKKSDIYVNSAIIACLAVLVGLIALRFWPNTKLIVNKRGTHSSTEEYDDRLGLDFINKNFNVDNVKKHLKLVLKEFLNLFSFHFFD
jgi:hypothetical protein